MPPRAGRDLRLSEAKTGMSPSQCTYYGLFEQLQPHVPPHFDDFLRSAVMAMSLVIDAFLFQMLYTDGYVDSHMVLTYSARI